MNNVTLAHIGGEMVIIGGLAFYCHKKNTELKNELHKLEEKNTELTEIVNKLQDHLQKLSYAFMQFQENSYQQQQPPPPPQKSVPPPPQKSVSPPPQKSVNLPPRTSRSRPLKNKTPAKITSISDDSESGDDTIADTELDKELDTELSKLNGKDCDGDTCPI